MDILMPLEFTFGEECPCTRSVIVSNKFTLEWSPVKMFQQMNLQCNQLDSTKITFVNDAGPNFLLTLLISIRDEKFFVDPKG